MKRFSGILLMFGALSFAAEASARDISIDDAGFAITLALPEGEPGCVVVPEQETIQKDCAGIDLDRLRSGEDRPSNVVAYVIDGGVVFVAVEYHEQPGRKYPTRQSLESWAADPVESAIATAPGVSASGEVVEVGGVGAVHVRMSREVGGRRNTARRYRVPAPKGMVQLGFGLIGKGGEAELDRFADATVATLRVAKPSPEAPTETPSTEGDWGIFIAGAMVLLAVLVLGGWKLTRPKTASDPRQ